MAFSSRKAFFAHGRRRANVVAEEWYWLAAMLVVLPITLVALAAIGK
jgi:hypothetical protein